jgi:hypothetical protein
MLDTTSLSRCRSYCCQRKGFKGEDIAGRSVKEELGALLHVFVLPHLLRNLPSMILRITVDLAVGVRRSQVFQPQIVPGLLRVVCAPK